ncbi:hypothetical protein LSAT2_018689 [Lamellibrachia satsuma]|nr:hypothetical protein LSAT2_018689 [Lamellibrachia satsuma]
MLSRGVGGLMNMSARVVFCPPVPLWSEAQFNSTDNNFLAVITYSCKAGSHFVDHEEDPTLERTALCNITKEWMPPITDCVAVEKLGASLKGKTYESPSSLSIGTLSCIILGFMLCGTVLLDLSKICSDLRTMRSNIRHMLKHRGTSRK